MMKKTLFMKLYRPIYIGFWLDIALLAAWFILEIFAYMLAKSALAGTTSLVSWVSVAIVATETVGLGLMLLLLFTTFILYADRLPDASISCTTQSVKQTLSLHRFLNRRDVTVTQLIVGVPANTKNSRVTSAFNRAVKKSVVDIQSDKVIVLVQLPYTQQSQEIFKTIDSQLKEYLANQMPDYYFSGATRDRNVLWFEGRKR
ncbi:hypothetical protein ACFP3T_13550 [Lactiplantibacillus dongliensis]|uniref:Integral membrane protein n=1 Tax=Lactiplantibacillus dongliensis TaxID=2559919 RepID=A0ABW1R728_9LACO|nr:hypothetical protein [Lactiplantibacillus dongliensis]